MVWAFLFLWAFGAALLLCSCALVWSERMSVLRTIPACADCAYPLQGLPRGSRCPECGGVRRRFMAPPRGKSMSEPALLVWLVPLLFGLIIPSLYSVGAKVPMPTNFVGSTGDALVYLAAGLLLRFMLRWVSLAAATAMMWCTVAVLTLVLGCVLIEATYGTGLTVSSAEVFSMSPMLIAPFIGYGMAMGIALLAWSRDRMRRLK